jgi:hypothetical protein
MTSVGRKPRAAKTPEQIWNPIAETELARPGVKGGTGFGRSEGLRVSNKIYAMLVNGELVVRIPKARVDELVEAGIGRRFEPSPGRVMKEWLSLPPAASRRWRSIVSEARAFVS